MKLYIRVVFIIFILIYSTPLVVKASSVVDSSDKSYTTNPFVNGNSPEAEKKINSSSAEDVEVDYSNEKDEIQISIAFKLVFIFCKIVGILMVFYGIICLFAFSLDIMRSGDLRLLERLTAGLGKYSRTLIIVFVLVFPIYLSLAIYISTGRIVMDSFKFANYVASKLGL